MGLGGHERTRAGPRPLLASVVSKSRQLQCRRGMPSAGAAGGAARKGHGTVPESHARRGAVPSVQQARKPERGVRPLRERGSGGFPPAGSPGSCAESEAHLPPARLSLQGHGPSVQGRPRVRAPSASAEGGRNLWTPRGVSGWGPPAHFMGRRRCAGVSGPPPTGGADRTGFRQPGHGPRCLKQIIRYACCTTNFCSHTSGNLTVEITVFGSISKLRTPPHEENPLDYFWDTFKITRMIRYLVTERGYILYIDDYLTWTMSPSATLLFGRTGPPICTEDKMYDYIRRQTCIWIYPGKYTHTYIHTHIYIYIYIIQKYIYIRKAMGLRRHTRIYIYILIHTHVYIYIYGVGISDISRETDF